MNTYISGYRLTRRKVDHVNKREVFYFTKGVGQYMTITIKAGAPIEVHKQVSGASHG